MTDYTLAGASGFFGLTGSDASLIPSVFPLGLGDDDGLQVSFTDTLLASWNLSSMLQDAVLVGAPYSDSFGWLPIFGFPRAVTETLELTPVSAILWQPVAVVAEVLKIHGVFSPNNIWNLTSKEQAVLDDIFGCGLSGLLADEITFNQFISVVRALVVLEQLTVKPRHFTKLAYGVLLADLLRVNPILAWFYGATQSENMNLTAALLPVKAADGQLAELVSLADILGETLQIVVTETDAVTLTDDNILQAIYKRTLSDKLCVTIGYLSPGGGFTTWAMNARSGAITEYMDYAFNSFAQMGDKYVGANPSGLYELDGDSDGGRPIIADLIGGLLQFSGSHFTAFHAAYLGLRGDGDFILKLTSGDGKHYHYRVKAHSLRTAKVQMGKGLRSRYFTWELQSLDGQDFDLDSLEFLPISSVRRV